MDDAKVQEVLARIKASADAARARQNEAAAAAKLKPRIMDPGDTGIDVPKADTRPYDFEASNAETRILGEADHGIPSEHPLDSPLDAETRVLSEEGSAVKRLAKARQDATRVLEEVPDPREAQTLRMKAQSRAMPQAEFSPTKSVEQLAQEDAERILGRKPLSPPEVGTMEGKPVVQETIKVPEEALGPKAEVSPELSAESKITSAAEDTADLQKAITKGASTVAEDAMEGTIKRSVPSASKRLAARYAAQLARESGEAAKASKWYTRSGLQRRAAKIGAEGIAKSGELIAKGLQAASDFNKASLAGKAWMATKGLYKIGKFGAETTLKDLVVPAAAEAAGKFGIINLSENLGATGRLPEMPGRGTTLGTEKSGFSSLIDANDEQMANLARYNATANKYGMRVTGRTGLSSIMGVPFLNRLIAPGPNIQIQEDPQLKAAYLARNKARIQAMKDSWLANQPKSHSE